MMKHVAVLTLLLGILACGGTDVTPLDLPKDPWTAPLTVGPVRTGAPTVGVCGEPTKDLCDDIAYERKHPALNKARSNPPLDCRCQLTRWGRAGTQITPRLSVGGNGKLDIDDTPLVLAVLNKYPELVHSLLQRGAHPNAKSPSGLPLQAALRAGSGHSARLLLEAGADLSAVDLGLGVGDYESERVLVLLVENGADASALTPFIGSKMDKDRRERKLEVLLAGGMSTKGLLHDVVETGEIELVQVVLAHDPDLSATNAEGETPLQVASEHPEIAALLRAK